MILLQTSDLWERILNNGTPLFILVAGMVVLVRYIFPRVMAYLDAQRLDQKARDEQVRLDTQRREEALMKTLAVREAEANAQTQVLQQQTQVMTQQARGLERINENMERHSQNQERHATVTDTQAKVMSEMLELVKRISQEQNRQAREQAQARSRKQP
jgi:predicted transcriptional regulator